MQITRPSPFRSLAFLAIMCGPAMVAMADGEYLLDLCAVAGSLGLSPESLAIAQVSVVTIESILEELNAATVLRQQLNQQLLIVNEQTEIVAALEAALRETPDDETLLADYSSASAALAGATASVLQARQGLMAIVAGELSESQLEQLAVFQSSLQYRVPASFRAVERTQEQWHALEQACLIVETAEASGQQADPQAVSLLASVESEQEVVAAAQSLNQLQPLLVETLEAFTPPSS